MDTAGEVLWGKVPLRDTGEMGSEAGALVAVVVEMLGGETGFGAAMVESMAGVSVG